MKELESKAVLSDIRVGQVAGGGEDEDESLVQWLPDAIKWKARSPHQI